MGSAELQGVLDDVRARSVAGGRPVVVFDVDSTLFSTSARHLAILRAFAWRHHDPELRAVAARARLDDFTWTVEGPLEAAGVGDRELYSALERFWEERFFSDSLCVDDLPVPGAVTYVREVARAGGLVVYLTARVARDMARGTVHGLLSWGFPAMDGRSVFVLKPVRQLSDAAFKQSAIDRIRRLGEVVATFENDTTNAHILMDAFPGGRHFLMETCRSPTAPPPREGLVRVVDFWGAVPGR